VGFENPDQSLVLPFLVTVDGILRAGRPFSMARMLNVV